MYIYIIHILMNNYCGLKTYFVKLVDSLYFYVHSDNSPLQNEIKSMQITANNKNIEREDNIEMKNAEIKHTPVETKHVGLNPENASDNYLYNEVYKNTEVMNGKVRVVDEFEIPHDKVSLDQLLNEEYYRRFKISQESRNNMQKDENTDIDNVIADLNDEKKKKKRT